MGGGQWGPRWPGRCNKLGEGILQVYLCDGGDNAGRFDVRMRH